MSDLVLSQLGEAVHKQSDSLHIFICPKMMLTLCDKILYKVTGLVLYAPLGGGGLTSLNDSFVVSFIFPLIAYRPWIIRGTPKVLLLVS